MQKQILCCSVLLPLILILVSNYNFHAEYFLLILPIISAITFICLYNGCINSNALCYFTGINRRVRYAMKESDGHFSIDPVSGIVSLTRLLDRESQSLFNLTIYAHDQVCHNIIDYKLHPDTVDLGVLFSHSALAKLEKNMWSLHPTLDLVHFSRDLLSVLRPVLVLSEGKLGYSCATK